MDDMVRCGDPFSADDLRDTVGEPDTSSAPNGKNNSIGSVFREYSAMGVIEAIGVEKSTTPTRKGGMIRIWRKTCSEPPLISE